VEQDPRRRVGVGGLEEGPYVNGHVTARSSFSFASGSPPTSVKSVVGCSATYSRIALGSTAAWAASKSAFPTVTSSSAAASDSRARRRAVIAASCVSPLDVGPDEPVGPGRDAVQVHVVREGHPTRVDVEDLATAGLTGNPDLDLAVEPTAPSEGGSGRVSTRLVAPMTITSPRASSPSISEQLADDAVLHVAAVVALARDRVDLVEEDDRGPPRWPARTRPVSAPPTRLCTST